MKGFCKNSDNPVLAQLWQCARLCKALGLGEIQASEEEVAILKGDRVNYRFPNMDKMQSFLEHSLERRGRSKRQQAQTARLLRV